MYMCEGRKNMKNMCDKEKKTKHDFYFRVANKTLKCLILWILAGPRRNFYLTWWLLSEVLDNLGCKRPPMLDNDDNDTLGPKLMDFDGPFFQSPKFTCCFNMKFQWHHFRQVSWVCQNYSNVLTARMFFGNQAGIAPQNLVFTAGRPSRSTQIQFSEPVYIDLEIFFAATPHSGGHKSRLSQLAMSGLPCHIILKWAIPVLPLSLVVKYFTEKQGDWQINGLC